ncbi:MAG: DUF2339 domain-containing protein [Gammaproteobacteria bacterium]|nr:DUF2339 domain-containing protein [Gammaproteobacteria bacterium]
MQVLFIIAGGLAGLWFGNAGEEILGMLAGAALGFLVARYASLRKQVEALDRQVEDLMALRSADAQAVGQEFTEPPATFVPRVDSETLSDAAGIPAVSPAPAEPLEPVRISEHAERSPEPTEPGVIEKIIDAAKSWITTGNVPVKIGVIVSFFGVGFLLKYAVERQVFVVPIELRYLGVATATLVLLGVGWRLRNTSRVYALSLQGGGIGILYLTIFAAFRLHDLLPAPFALLMLVALTAGTGVLAVLQDAKALAVFGTVGGFIAPILVSTGSGNHVALFSYYLLLNAAILGIAWYKAWRVLNVLGFVFTFGVGAAWGYRYFEPQKLASTEPFLIAFFLFYQAIAILFAFRQPPNLKGYVDGTLVFGTPVVAFALQSQLVEGSEYGLAISAMAMAIFYTIVAVALNRAQGKQMRLLIESFIALAVAFATIAIPLALDDRWTAAAWSLEGAALVWIGVRQNGILARLSGGALLFAGGVAYVKYGWDHDAGMPVLNGNFVGGMLISIASLFSARYLAADARPMRWQSFIAVPLMLWGLGWWGGTGFMEIIDRTSGSTQLNLFVLFIALSVCLLAWVARRYAWTAARRATLAYLPILAVVALLYIWDQQHLFRGVGTVAWIVALIAHFGLLRAYDNGRGRVEGLWHFAGALMLTAFIGFEAGWRLRDAGLSEVWALAAALLLPALVALAIIFGRGHIPWPLQRYWTAYIAAAGTLVASQLWLVGMVGAENAGDPAPLPYVPLLNPLDMLTVIGLVVALRVLLVARKSSEWIRDDQYRVALIVWGIGAFILTTLAVVRAVHHFSDVSWDSNTLSGSVQVQAALSIYWAILGFGGMILGARHGKRWIWLTGTALMALVVIKLFIVDLGNTGTVARIVSFLGVGVLLLIVGYFAPAPPRRAARDNDLAQELP